MRRLAAVVLGALMILVSTSRITRAEPAATEDPQESTDRPGPMLFTEVGRTLGIDFVHTFGAEDLTSILQDTGSGLAWIDYDGDGFPDLFVTGGRTLPDLMHPREPARFTRASTCRLYHNERGQRFVDVTDRAGLTTDIYAMGACSGDYDGDGFVDLYVTGYKGNRLFRNRGNGTFDDVTAAAGVALSDRWSTGATFLDYDNDGHLDLYVGGYLVYDPAYKYFYPADAYPGPLAYRPQSSTLFRNAVDGTFVDVSTKTGISLNAGRTMGVAAADFNGDGFIDIFAANDGSANFLLVNQGGRFFADQASTTRVALGHGNEGAAAMGPEWADLNGDGHFDLFVPDNKGGELFVFDPARKMFKDWTIKSGVAAASAQFVGWGSGAQDFDNDGFPDLYQVNGDLNHLQPQEDLLFRGTGTGMFDDVSLSCGAYFSEKYQGRGAAFADFNRDGNVDVAVVTLNGPLILLRNDTPHPGHWIDLKLVGRRLKDPIGATLTATVGAKIWAMQMRGGSGYLSQSERLVHIGLGAEKALAKVEVAWPGGVREIFENLPADQVVTIVEGKGRAPR